MSTIQTAKIKFIDDQEGQFGPQKRLKCALQAGGDVTVWVSATHKDQAGWEKGANILVSDVIADSKGSKGKYVGLAPSDAATPAQQPASAPQAATKEPVTLEQVTKTWVKIYQHLADRLPDQDEKSRRKSATTVFIAACQAGAFWKG